MKFSLKFEILNTCEFFQFPQQFPQNNFNRDQNYPPDYNNNNYLQYDVDYERRIRIETEKLRQLLIDIDKKSSEECTANVAAQWNFETNVNEVSQLEAVSSFRCRLKIWKNDIIY